MIWHCRIHQIVARIVTVQKHAQITKRTGLLSSQCRLIGVASMGEGGCTPAAEISPTLLAIADLKAQPS